MSLLHTQHDVAKDRPHPMKTDTRSSWFSGIRAPRQPRMVGACALSYVHVLPVLLGKILFRDGQNLFGFDSQGRDRIREGG